MYVCLCKGITESDVKQCGRNGCVTPQALVCRLGIDADDCCGRCLTNLEEIVALACNDRMDVACEFNSRPNLRLRR
jgi:bacterioferritin-associated ferredoxin